MSRDRMLVILAVLLMLSALSLQNQIRTTGKAAYELSGTFQVIDEPPKLQQAIPNYTIKPTQNNTVSLNLSAYFKEPNRQEMTYSYAAPVAVNVSLDNITGEINLTIKSDWKGRANITFTAYDTLNNNLTTSIEIVIREINITKSKFDTVTSIGWYEGQNSGTLDINSLADGELENSTGIAIENLNNGKILFAESINISQDTNLDAAINISDNYIELDSSALPNFDKPATLWLYNLTFTNPRILKDGAVCPETECAKINFSTSSGILIFNVTGFTAYSADETPSAAPQAAAPSGKGGGAEARRVSGGAAGFVEKPTAFEVDRTGIKADVKQNRVKTEVVKVSNPSDSEMKLDISTTKDIGFIYNDKSISLAPGETKDLELRIAPTEEDKPDSYLTNLVINDGQSEKLIRMLINVQTLLQLMDMDMEIYSEGQTVAPKEDLLAGLRLYNLGESPSIDVNVGWYVKDFDNNIFITESDVMKVETQAAFIKKVYIPSTIEPGEYVLVAIATYDDTSTVASSLFNVVSKPVIERPMAPEQGILMLLVAVAAALLILVIILIIIIWCERKEIRILLRVSERFMGALARGLERAFRKAGRAIKGAFGWVSDRLGRRR